LKIKLKAPGGKDFIPSPSQRQFMTSPKPFVYYSGGLGCVSKDTLINVNRGGNGTRITIENAYLAFNNIKKNRIRGWDKSIPTMIRSLCGPRVALNKVNHILYSGKKKVFKLTLDNGNSIKATEDHKIMTMGGWIRLDNLTIADYVMCDTRIPIKSSTKKRKRDKYALGLRHHPYAYNFDERGRGRIEIHRAIYEAFINNLPMEEYLNIMRRVPEKAKDLWCIDPSKYHIHHINEDHYDNRIENLQLITILEHKKQHANYGNLSQGIPTFSQVKSIEFIGIEDTYDVCCNYPFNNFCANDIVIHNSGKSLAGAMSGFLLAYRSPGSFGVVVREDIPSLKQSTMRLFSDVIPPEVVSDFNKQDRVYTLKNGSQIIFISSDNPEKVRSWEIDWYLIEEANKVSKEFHDEIIRRLRNPKVPASRYRGMYISNPTSKEHWLYKLFNSGDANFEFIKNTTYENAAHLPPGYIAMLESTMSPENVRRFLHGENNVDFVGIPVYSGCFNAQLHVGSLEYNPARVIMRGWDFGFRHPACVWFQMDDDGRILVLDEMLGKDIALREFAQQVIGRGNRMFPDAAYYQDFCDPAGNQKKDDGERSVEILKEILGAVPINRSSPVLEGIEILRGLMTHHVNGKMLFNIDKRCENLIEGFNGGYHYDDKREDFIVKDGYYEHLQDALRMGILSSCGFKHGRDAQSYKEEYQPRNTFTGY